MRSASLLLALLFCHTPATAQNTAGGIAIGLHGTRFPNWSFGAFNYRSPGLLGVSLSGFPIWRVGVRASVGTTGPRVYSEDNGFDFWQVGIEARILQVGRFTPFAGTSYGGVTESRGLAYRYLGGEAGVYARLIGPLSLRLALDYLHPTSWDDSGWVPSGAGPVTKTLGWQIELNWRIIRFGS